MSQASGAEEAGAPPAAASPDPFAEFSSSVDVFGSFEPGGDEETQGLVAVPTETDDEEDQHLVPSVRLSSVCMHVSGVLLRYVV